MVQDYFWKNVFLTHFGPIFGFETAIFKAFWAFPWPKARQHGPKSGQKHLFEHRKWSRNTFRKNVFFRPGNPGGLIVGLNHFSPKIAPKPGQSAPTKGNNGYTTSAA